MGMGSNFVNYLGPDGSLHLDNDLSGHSYAAAPNGNIAFLADNKLMLKTTPTALASTLIKLPDGSYNLSISQDGHYILVYSDLSIGDAHVKTKNFTNYIINSLSPSETNKFTTNAVITDAVWNSDDNSLAYTSGTQINLYNRNSQKSSNFIANFKTNPPTPLGFIGNHRLIYAQDSNLWSLDTSNSQSAKLSSYGGSPTPEAFTYYESNKTLYYSTDPDTKGRGGQIYKLQLNQ